MRDFSFVEAFAIQEGAHQKNKLGEVAVFSFFYGTYVQIIGSEAPGNYSASFWSNKVSVLLCVGPKPTNIHELLMFGPLGHRICGFENAQILKNI